MSRGYFSDTSTFWMDDPIPRIKGDGSVDSNMRESCHCRARSAKLRRRSRAKRTKWKK